MLEKEQSSISIKMVLYKNHTVRQQDDVSNFHGFPEQPTTCDELEITDEKEDSVKPLTRMYKSTNPYRSSTSTTLITVLCPSQSLLEEYM